MNKIMTNNKKVVLLIFLSILASVFYLSWNIDKKYISFALSYRAPKLLVMIITAFCIGAASLVFQTIINNTIVTPCLLGMNSLYLLIHTAVIFVLGSSSVFVTNTYLSFAIDLIIMASVATFTYGYLFKKTRYNVLYVLLAGTVMATFFTSIQNSMVRIMDPNEYDSLLSTLVANLSNVNTGVIGVAVILIILVAFFLREELKVLDVIALGKNQAINLGVEFDLVVRKLLIGVTLLIAIATAMIGPVSFLGLIIANVSRQLFKTGKHFYLILGTIFIGMVILIGGQLFVEHLFSYSIPISVFINVGGGMYFLYLLLAQTKKGFV